MRDGRTEGALRLGPLDVHVDPLVVAGQTGERVDVLLRDSPPVRRADGLPDQRPELLDAVDGDLGHVDQA